MRHFLTGRIGRAAAISILVLFILLATERKIGVTWDEPAYMAASRSYIGWFKQVLVNPAYAFSDEGITNAWTINSEHPPVDKVWSGVVWALARNVTDDLMAHRLGNMILSAVLSGLLYLFVQEGFGEAAGVVAVVSLMTMPRFFFHAHLAALDVPAAFSVFFITYVFWKTLTRKGWRWGMILGLIWGLALATKINAVFVPLTLGIWLLIFRREMKLFLRLILMGLTAIPVFILSWPWLYYHPLSRLHSYFKFLTTDHWEIGQYYLGRFYLPPPWHFGFVMIWAVIPLSLTVLYSSGVARVAFRKEAGGLGWLLILSGLTHVVVLSTGRSMVYDNDRLLMAVYPFLAALAGMGFDWILKGFAALSARLNNVMIKQGGSLLLVFTAFVPQLVSMARLYPHYLSYYSESVGGLEGAGRIGLETTYWCETYNLAFPIINGQAMTGDRLWVDPWSHDVLIYYQTIGYLRKDLVVLAPPDAPEDVSSILGADAPRPEILPMESADWYLVQHRQTTLGIMGEDSLIAKVLRNRQAVYEFQIDGVPIFTLYKK